ncbi:hypothetical protein T06_2265 [Trichinella sp. T6]|nr:hypothetical protein T06_2265 [Trichinella sp. T6]
MALSFQTYALCSLNANSRATAVNDVRRMNNGVFKTMTDKE